MIPLVVGGGSHDLSLMTILRVILNIYKLKGQMDDAISTVCI